jgi:hypothetical protein
MVDVADLLFGLESQVYGELGVPAVFVAEGTAGEIALTVIDDTRRKIEMAGPSVEVSGVGPGAYVRVQELIANGIMREDYKGAMLTFNGRSWTVRKHEFHGSPKGEDFGEVRLFLMEAAAAPSPAMFYYLVDADGAYIVDGQSFLGTPAARTAPEPVVLVCGPH